MFALTRQSASRLFLLILVCGCVVSTATPTWPGELLRTELARLQEQTGLSLATVVYRGVQVVVFAHRTLVKARELPGGMGMVSPDGTEVAFNTGLERSPGRVPRIGISRTDGKDFREYENIEMDGNKCCWSHDKSRLVLTVLKATSSSPGLLTLNLNSGVTQIIADHGSVTTQCWSPDDKQFVYEMDANVQIHDVGDNRSRRLTSGKEPTWSPDGSRIAFLDDDTYYVIHHTGEDKHVLFKKWHPASGLWWSPDSQFVAYVSQARLLEGGLSALDVETYWLRVRRLKDNSESRVAGAGSESYQWVANSELFREAASHYGHAPVGTVEHNGEVFVVGHVSKQGWYPVKNGENILQVIQAAGELLAWAKADSIYVQRTENNKQRRIPCHFNRGLQGREKPIPLQPGDVVVVP